MKMSTTKKTPSRILVGVVMCCMLALMVLLWSPNSAFAAITIEPSGDTTGAKDRTAIIHALESDGHVVLKPGETYYTSGNIYLESGNTITATGATIIGKKGVLRNMPTDTGYNSVSDIVIDGGLWTTDSSLYPDGYPSTMIQFSHARNITIKNLTIECNLSGHAIELIGCKDVLVDSCNMVEIGTVDPKSVEEALQIDIAASVTAPWVAEQGSQYANGLTCENITVRNCLIRGSRGVCANYASNAADAAYLSNYHKNIVLENNTIVGMSAEGVALFNVAGATVKNNVIVSYSGRVDEAYSVGLHFHIFGDENNSQSAYASSVYNIDGNSIMGSRQGLYFYSFTKSTFGTANITNNTIGSYNSVDDAEKIRFVGAVNESNNELYKWNGVFNTNIENAKPGYTPTHNVTATKTGWKSDSKGWWYQESNGSYPKNQWKAIGGKWYYFSGSGYMKTGWLQDGKAWYYLGDNGAMKTGWVQVGKAWYYMNKSGVMQTGWLQLGKTWYYLKSSGAMATGWQSVGGKWYYLDGSGHMKTGWQAVSGKWYYLNKSGVMQTGWQKVSGKWYYMNGSGVMQAKKWIGSYYVDASGVMATNTWIGNYHVNASGLWDKTA